MGFTGALGRKLRRLASSNEELESEELQKEAARHGCQAVGRCPDRSRVMLSGTIASLAVQPVDGTKWLEADFKDGSGEVTLIWMGRRSVPGIEAGSVLRVEGRISKRDGRTVLFNPRYELLSVPS